MSRFDTSSIEQDNNTIVSIIIPSYNAELYIGACLDSLIHQTYSALEIICVDDGSTDNTYHILETYHSMDNRIKLLKQNHQTAGAARNCGIRNANGKYLLFVDADDFCMLDMLEKLVKKAESEHTDVLVFDLLRYDNISKKAVDDSWTAVHQEYFGEGVKAAMDLKDTIFQFTTSGPMNKLFLREFIVENNIWFQPIPRTNDLFFVYAAMTYAERIAVLNEKLQYYRMNNSGSLQATNDRSPLAFIEALRALKDNLMQRDIYGYFKGSYLKMAVEVSLFNLASQESKRMYAQVLSAVWDNMESLNTGINNLNSTVQTERLTQILSGEDGFVIYGAGKLAEVFVKYLLFIRCIDQERIKIIVSQRSYIQDMLCGIKIGTLNEWSEKDGKFVYVLAVNDKQVRNEMRGNLRKKGIENIIGIDFECMLALIKMGEAI